MVRPWGAGMVGLLAVGWVYLGGPAAAVADDDPFGLRDDPAVAQPDSERCGVEDAADRFDCVPQGPGSPVRTTLSSAFIERIVPIDFSAAGVLSATPGSQGDPDGLSMAGAYSIENRFEIDGGDATGVRRGDIGVAVPLELVDRIDVYTGGLPASHRGATGGVVEVTTRRGTDRATGSVTYAWDRLYEAELRRPYPEPSSAIDSEYDRGFQHRLAAEVGGPIVPGRLWYQLGAAPHLRNGHIERRVQRRTDYDQDGLSDLDEHGRPQHEVIEARELPWHRHTIPMLARVDARAAPGHDGAVTFVGTYEGAQWVGAVHGERSAGEVRRSELASQLTARWRSEWGQGRSALELQGGWHRYGSSLGATSPELADTPQTRLFPYYGDWLEYESEEVQQACRDGDDSDPFPFIVNCPAGFAEYLTGGPGQLGDELAHRLGARVAGIHHVEDVMGAHRIEGGLETETRRLRDDDILSGGQLVQAFDPSNPQVIRYVEVGEGPGFDRDCAGTPCRYLDAHRQRSRTDYLAVFFQDTWTPATSVEIDAGLRYERQAVEDRFALAQLAPRVGASYDWTRSGRSRTYGFWGRYYQALPLDFNHQAFSRRATFYEGGAPEDLLAASEPNPVDPSLAGAYTDEFLAGTEHVLGEHLLVGATVQRRSLGRAIEDVFDGQDYVVTNPGEGLGGVAARRVWTAFSVSAASAPVASLVFRASYTHARLRGNYRGPYDETTGGLLHLHPIFDTADHEINIDGLLPGDLPHHLKIDGYHRSSLFGGSLWVGFRVRAFSGQPTNALESRNRTFLLPRGSLPRTPWATGVSLRVGYERAWLGTNTLEIFADVSNVFNRQDVAAVNQFYTHDDARPIDGGDYEDLVFAKSYSLTGEETPSPLSRNRFFGDPTSYYAPLAARIGLRARF